MNGIGFQALRRTLLVGSLALATGAVAQSGIEGSTPGTGISDAQVEANVLRALASAPDLANQNIQSTSVFGAVTLTGNVHDEAMRTEAENLVARTAGVKKVVDELALGDTPPPAQDDAQADNQGAPPPDQQGNPDQQGEQQAYAQPAPDQQGQLQSDGSDAPTPPQAGNNAPPMQDQSAPYNPQQSPQPGYQPPNGQPYPPQAGQQYPGGYGPPQDQTAPNGQPYPQAGQQYPGGYAPPQNQPAPNGQPYPPQAGQQYPGGYGPPQNGQYPDQAQGQSQAQYPPDQSQPYGASPNGPPPRRPLYQNGPPQNYAPQGGQQAGLPVTVPSGALLRVRINRGLDSNHIQPGTPFNGTVLSDIPADGAIAIPRGAFVQGVVVDAAKTKALSGKGELALQINSVTLGGVTYPLSTDVWQRQGRDKTASTVNHAVGLGALGAIIGGIAGGGAGAAIGAGVGAGAGVASSAGTPGGRVIVPPEAVLTFHLAQPAVVKTVSEQEMARLAYAAGATQQQPPMRRYYNPNYGYYYAPY